MPSRKCFLQRLIIVEGRPQEQTISVTEADAEVLPVDAYSSKKVAWPRRHLGHHLHVRSLKVNGRIELFDPYSSGYLTVFHG